MLAVLLAVVYGGTYFKPDFSFRGLQDRLSVLFIVAGVLPLLAMVALPVYSRNSKVRAVLS